MGSYESVVSHSSQFQFLFSKRNQNLALMNFFLLLIFTFCFLKNSDMLYPLIKLTYLMQIVVVWVHDSDQIQFNQSR